MSGPGFDHAALRDSAAAYVLGALPQQEELEFEEHLATCPSCREEVENLRVASDALAMSVPTSAPPPALKARIMAVVEQEAALLRAAGPEADRPGALERGGGRRWLSLGWLARPAVALAAALVVLALGTVIGIVSAGGLGGGDDVRRVQAEVAPGMPAGMRVVLEVGEAGAALVGDGMPAPPAGRVYQVWVKRPGSDPEPTSTLFTPTRDGSVAAAVPVELEGVEAVLVSHEPRGGSPAPTSDPVVTVAPPA